MFTVAVLTALELWLYASGVLDLPGHAETALLVLLLGALTLTPSLDVRRGYVSRLLLVMGILWWWGSTGRLLPAFAAAYGAAPGPIGEAMAVLALFGVAAAMVAAPAIEYLPRPKGWRPWEA